jgi:hypothetical protein
LVHLQDQEDCSSNRERAQHQGDNSYRISFRKQPKHRQSTLQRSLQSNIIQTIGQVELARALLFAESGKTNM